MYRNRRMVSATHQLTEAQARPLGIGYDAQESYFRIPSTAILSRTARGTFHLFEAHYSNRVFRELNRIAREGGQVAGVICDKFGALDRGSIRAVNVYLRTMGRIRGVNRFDWLDFSEDLALRWVR